jgi:hypothetical protein
MFQSFCLSRKLAGSSISESEMKIHDMINIKDFIEWLKDIPSNVIHLTRELDLSFSYLFDDDFDDIITMLKLLPYCNVVNLSGLSLRGISVDKIQQIVNMRNVSYLILCFTQLAITVRIDLFDGLYIDDLRKIVFIHSNQQLQIETWHSTVRDEAKRKVVVKTHERFFEECHDIVESLHKKHFL